MADINYKKCLCSDYGPLKRETSKTEPLSLKDGKITEIGEKTSESADTVIRCENIP